MDERAGIWIAKFWIYFEYVNDYATEAFLETVRANARCFDCDLPIASNFTECPCVKWQPHQASASAFSRSIYYMPEEIYAVALRKDARAVKARRAAQIRQERLEEASCRYSMPQLAWLKNAQNEECYYCGSDIAGCYQIEHLRSVSSGGCSSILNVMLACKRCNTRKHILTERQFWNILRKEIPAETYSTQRMRAKELKRSKRALCRVRCEHL